MKDALKLGLKLFIICVIAGALLGGTYVITKEPIEQVTIKAATEARQAVLPDAATFEEFDVSVIEGNEAYAGIESAYIGYDAAGTAVGATVAMNVTGFNSGLHFTVGIGADGTVKGLKIGDHTETPGLGAKASEDWFQDQFKGLTTGGTIEVIKNGTVSGDQILAIAGATRTSRGVSNGTNTACNFYNEFMNK